MNAIPFIFPAINITKLRNRESVNTETKLKLTFHNYLFFKYKENCELQENELPQ